MSRVEINSLARSWWDVWHGMSGAVVSGEVTWVRVEWGT